jgi:hypothetical protein
LLADVHQVAVQLALPALFGYLAMSSLHPDADPSAAIYARDDPYRKALSRNRSIHFMLAVPYTLVSLSGFYCYRHLRRNGAV